MAGLTRPVSGLLKLVRSMHTITIANETHLIESTRILVNPLHQRILCIHSCRSPALQDRLPRCTQICLSNAGIGLPPAVVRQRPSTIAATLKFVYRMRESESPLLYSTAATQHNCCNPEICLSNAGFRQPVAGINQRPNIHAQTMPSPITPLTHHTPRQLFSSHTRN